MSDAACRPGSGAAAAAPRPRRSPGIDQLAVLWTIVAALVAAAVAAAPRWVPSTPACPVRTALDVPCPGCGTGRALLHVARGRPLDALVAHPLPTLALAALVGGGIAAGLLVLAGRDLPRPGPRMLRRLRAGLVVLLISGWCHAVLTGV